MYNNHDVFFFSENKLERKPEGKSVNITKIGIPVFKKKKMYQCIIIKIHFVKNPNKNCLKECNI